MAGEAKKKSAEGGVPKKIDVRSALFSMLEDMYEARREAETSKESIRRSLFSMLEDVHESKKELEKAYEDLKALDKMKDEFFFMISHEMKTPLTPMVSLERQLLDRRHGELTEKQEYILKIISQETQRLQGSIKKILEIQRLESGRFEFRKEKLQLAQLVQDVVKNMKQSAELKHISFTQEIPKLPLVEADRRLVNTVLTNLVENAVKFTPEGGKVTMEAGQEGDYVIVRVRDTGPGIAKENLPKLFDKFFQVDHTEPGFGLGLSICKIIVDVHGGKIWAESELGQGSTFSFALPIKR